MTRGEQRYNYLQTSTLETLLRPYEIDIRRRDDFACTAFVRPSAGDSTGAARTAEPAQSTASTKTADTAKAAHATWTAYAAGSTASTASTD